LQRALKNEKRGKSLSDVILRLLEGKRERSFEVLERYTGLLAESDLFEIVTKENL